MSLPNLLTLSRIIFAVILVFLLQGNTQTGNILAVIIFAIASLTDFYDGHLAKKRGLVSDFGKIMDPVADKILLLSTIGVLAYIGMVAWWMFIVIAIREVLVTAFRLWAMGQGKVLAAERAGKIKTVVQITAVSTILLYLVAQQSEYCSFWFYNVQRPWQLIDQGILLAAVILTVYSGLEFGVTQFGATRRNPN
jgi:CDP-diacylglycerol--glycerol-3-phosphate 3-phosphatidyltransferase